MTSVIAAKCVDCRDTFTIEAAVEHSKPKVCCEWSNHAMSEVNFIIAEVDPSEVHIFTTA